MDSNWTNTPEDWVENYTTPNPSLPPKDLAGIARYTSFMAEIHGPTCLRFLKPQLLQNGREIEGTVEEQGELGAPDWVWRFFVTEIVTGPVEWRVTTVDTCKGQIA